QPARRRHAALHRVEQLGKMTVAGIEARVRIGDADHGPGELVRRVAHRAGEGAAHVDGEVSVAVVLQAAQETALWVVVAAARHGACSALDCPVHSSGWMHISDQYAPSVNDRYFFEGPDFR